MLALAALAVVAGCGRGSESGAPVHPPSRLARDSAVRWVTALQHEDLRAACHLETDRARRQTRCGSLRPLVYHCPALIVGHPTPRVPARRAGAQVGVVKVRGDRAAAGLKSERRSVAGVIATVVLYRQNSAWLVSGVRYRHRTFDFLHLSQPGGEAAAQLYARLFVAGCETPVFRG
jgi:hypothetical protein